MCNRTNNLVGDVLATDRIDDFIIDDLHGAVGAAVEIEVGGVSNGMGLDLICHAEWVEFWMWFSWKRFLVLNR